MNTQLEAESLGLEEEEFIELVGLFVDAGVSDLKQLLAGIEQDDAVQVAMAAHSIKGAAASLGLDKVLAAAEIIERDARKSDLGRTSGTVRTLNEELIRIAAWIGRMAGANDPQNSRLGE